MGLFELNIDELSFFAWSSSEDYEDSQEKYRV